MWPVLREGFYYALLSLSLSVAGYEGEIMRGAFLGVPRGELEAARSFGMSGWKVLSRVWFPRATLQVLPTLAGEMISQLKSTPLAFTVTVMELMGARSKISSDTYIIYEPLVLIAVIYMILTFFITRGFNYLERLIPQRR
jgi:polar amino acid transport system permease protein